MPPKWINNMVRNDGYMHGNTCSFDILICCSWLGAFYYHAVWLQIFNLIRFLFLFLCIVSCPISCLKSWYFTFIVSHCQPPTIHVQLLDTLNMIKPNNFIYYQLKITLQVQDFQFRDYHMIIHISNLKTCPIYLLPETCIY